MTIVNAGCQKPKTNYAEAASVGIQKVNPTDPPAKTVCLGVRFSPEDLYRSNQSHTEKPNTPLSGFPVIVSAPSRSYPVRSYAAQPSGPETSSLRFLPKKM